MSISKPCFAGVCAVLLTVGLNAEAHIALRSPTARLEGDATNFELKQGPCGQASNARTENVTEFAPGETITVEWDEYIPHPGYIRIAFDDDGDDSFPIRADMDSINTDTDDPEAVNPVDGTLILGYSYETGSNGTKSLQVTLPNVECENCTLQVIQFMYNGVGNNQDDEYYFQCADLALRGDGGGAGGATSTSSTTGADMGGASSTSATTGLADSTATTTGVVGMGGASSTAATATTGAVGTTGTTGAPATSTTGVGGATGTTAMAVGGASTMSTGVGGSSVPFNDDTVAPADEGGCGCRMVGLPGRGGAALAMLGLGLFWARRRR